MKKRVGTMAALGVLVSVSLGAQAPREQTWTGKISDSNCNAKHPGGEHEGRKMTDGDCTRVCVAKGAKYVFVSKGTIYQISNQDSKTIATHAGEEVNLTGELTGNTIKATKIAPVKPAK
jgi:hypothetical protein